MSLWPVLGGCSAEIIPVDGGFTPTLGSVFGDNAPGGGGSADGLPSGGLEVHATKPFCCNELERTFSVLLDGQALPAGARCEWDFGDGHLQDGCTVDHSFRWAGSYTVVLAVTLPDGETLLHELPLDIGTTNGPAGGEALVVALGVYTQPVIEATPGEQVVLRAVVTVDPADAGVSVHWRQVFGTRVELDEPAAARTAFVLPDVGPDAVLEFEVTAVSGTLSSVSAASVFVAYADPDVVTVEDDDVDHQPADDTDTAWADDVQFGYHIADATDAVQSAIDSGAGTVVIPDTGDPWIVRPIMLRSDLRLIIESGVILEAKPGGYPGNTDSVLSAINVENVTIEASGATIRMPTEEYIPPFAYPDYVAGEWRHAVNLRGARSVVVRGLHVDGTGGDGIYIGPTFGQPRMACYDIVLQGCRIDGSYRNGISIVSGENVVVDGCTITGTGGTPPQAAVVIEPADFGDRLVNVEVRNTFTDVNQGSGFFVNLSKQDERSLPVSVLITDGRVRESHQSGLRAILGDGGVPGGTVEFRRCEVEATVFSGAWARWDPAAPTRLGFTECVWDNVARNGGVSPLELELLDSGTAGAGGGIEFADCTLHDTRDRDPFHLLTTIPTSADVFGYIRVFNPEQDSAGLTHPPDFPQLVLDYGTGPDG